jgi:hypothetical protein
MKAFIILFLVGTLFMPVLASAGPSTLSFEPSQGDYEIGETITVEVLLDTQGQDVNAVASYIRYPSTILQVVSLDTARSPMEFIIERNYGAGNVDIAGGTPTPGFRGTYTLATIEFQAIAPGSATVSFDSESAVLLDKGNTTLFHGGSSAVFSIGGGVAPPPVSPAAYASPVETFTANSFFASVIAFLLGLF